MSKHEKEYKKYQEKLDLQNKHREFMRGYLACREQVLVLLKQQLANEWRMTEKVLEPVSKMEPDPSAKPT